MSNYSAEVFLSVHRLSDLPNARSMLAALYRTQPKQSEFSVAPIDFGVTQKAADRMVRDGLLSRVTDARDPRPSRYNDQFRLTPTGMTHSRRLFGCRTRKPR